MDRLDLAYGMNLRPVALSCARRNFLAAEKALFVLLSEAYNLLSSDHFSALENSLSEYTVRGNSLLVSYRRRKWLRDDIELRQLPLGNHAT